jgi:hypothetical protein
MTETTGEQKASDPGKVATDGQSELPLGQLDLDRPTAVARKLANQARLSAIRSDASLADEREKLIAENVLLDARLREIRLANVARAALSTTAAKPEIKLAKENAPPNPAVERPTTPTRPSPPPPRSPPSKFRTPEVIIMTRRPSVRP